MLQLVLSVALMAFSLLLPSAPIDPKPKIPSPNLFLIVENNKYGYMNERGLVMVRPRFDTAYDFQEGLARVYTQTGAGGSYGYIFVNRQGKAVIGNYLSSGSGELAGDFKEGLALVKRTEPCPIGKGQYPKVYYGYIDKTGKIVLPMRYQSAGSFSEGLASVKINKKYGFINRLGQIVIWPRFESAGDFNEGYAPVMTADTARIDGDFDYPAYDQLTNEKWGFIDKSGRIVVQPRYKWVGPFKGGLAGVGISDKPKKCGYVNKSGGLVWVSK